MDSKRYQDLEELGKGTFGSVVLARDTATGEHVAIKRMELTCVHKHYIAAEILNHSALHHPHVVGFRHVHLTQSAVNIVMDYASGGSLLELVQRRRRLREPLARWFFQQLVIGVDYCHKKGVANRDIKLDNLLLQPVEGLPQPLLLICDFGYSSSQSDSGEARADGFSRVGTLNYVAPEVLQNTGYDNRKVDIWSCGVVLYAMLAGSLPFAAPDTAAPPALLAASVARMLRQMHARAPDLPEDLKLSPQVVRLLLRLLEPLPEARIGLDEDPWFLTNMPSNALAMNREYLSLQPARQQTAAQISAVVDAITSDGCREAGSSSDSEFASSGDSDDDSLDHLALS